MKTWGELRIVEGIKRSKAGRIVEYLCARLARRPAVASDKVNSCYCPLSDYVTFDVWVAINNGHNGKELNMTWNLGGDNPSQ